MRADENAACVEEPVVGGRSPKLAQEVGADVEKFKAALDSGKHKAKVDADSEVGSKAGIGGTPAFVINGYFINGAQPAPAFKKLIAKALKETGG